jgi:hypothetical protein
MKKIFYLGIISYIFFEIANVYFIMPMPGSQEMNSINVAYFLYTWRWVFRLVSGVLILAGIIRAFQSSKIFPLIAILVAAGIAYMANFKMAAETMFLQTRQLKMADAASNAVDTLRLILGIEYQGQAKAYPIQYLGYHHQVMDTIADKPVLITYCTVCRTGRVFEPVVNGRTERFRLVGMDHFNAMFEDHTTHSWWRQVTGEAITGPLKGKVLPEWPSSQMSLKQWLSFYPNSLIMQPDPAFQLEYDSLSNYEGGRRTGKLTRRDSLSWQKKSWVVGISLGKESKAYDWNTLENKRIIYDNLDHQPIALILGNDNRSFVALKRTSDKQRFTLHQDTISDGQNRYLLTGASLDPAVPDLGKIRAYQEYWHSWRTFHPGTKR